MLFNSKKIKENEATVAEKLRTARENKNISLLIAAKTLAINPEYLAAMEDNNYAALPAGVYAKTFLRTYAIFLGLNARSLINQYLREKGEPLAENKDVFSHKKIAKRELLIFPKLLKNILLIAAIVIFFLYLGYYLLNIFSLPQLEIYQPADNLVTTASFIDVIGHAHSKTQITINGQQVLKDGNGNFDEKVNLNNGINTLVISAQNKYSRIKTITKQILVK